MVIFNDEYIEKAKVGIIIITATIFDLRLMLLCSFQSRINGPKSLWLINQFSRNDDDFEKNHALSNKNGVVGIPCIMIPINPSQTNRDPKPMNKYFLINFLVYLNQSVNTNRRYLLCNYLYFKSTIFLVWIYLPTCIWYK